MPTSTYSVYSETFFLWLLVHEPDWHWPPCQSGAWKYTTLNFTTSTYNIGKNTYNKSIGVHAYCAWTYLNGSPLAVFNKCIPTATITGM